MDPSFPHLTPRRRQQPDHSDEPIRRTAPPQPLAQRRPIVRNTSVSNPEPRPVVDAHSHDHSTHHLTRPTRTVADNVEYSNEAASRFQRRQTTQRGKTTPRFSGQITKKIRNRRHVLRVMAYAGALILAVLVVLTFVRIATQKDETLLLSNQKPSDPQFVEKYMMAAGMPRILEIPSLSVRARVQVVERTHNNILDQPPNAFDVAWYTGSSLPETNGAQLFEGVVKAREGEGVFAKLNTLKAGDQIVIEKGDRKKIEYVVKRVSQVDTKKQPIHTILASIEPSKPGVNLVTCDAGISLQTLVQAVQE